MKKLAIAAALLVFGIVGVFAVNRGSALADDSSDFRARLNGYNEVPSVSTTGSGTFTARIDNQTITYRLTYSSLSTTPTAAHIHLGQEHTNGGVIAFLCGGGGKPACPADGTVNGTIVPADIIGPAVQGIAAGEFDEAVRAMRHGATYANVHSTMHPGGEIRGQIRRGDGGDDHD